MQLLFIDCCMRQRSRTKLLCDHFLKTYISLHSEDTLQIRDLKSANLQYYTEELITKREQLLKQGIFSHPLFSFAQEFAKADKIIIGAPYWDLSFPALLKIYFETIFVNGITFCYQHGKPVGLCHAKKLLYITTSGGFIETSDYGTAYIQGVCNMFGIPSFSSLKAEGLDIIELEPQKFLTDSIKEAEGFASYW